MVQLAPVFVPSHIDYATSRTKHRCHPFTFVSLPFLCHFFNKPYKPCHERSFARYLGKYRHVLIATRGWNGIATSPGKAPPRKASR